MSDSPGQQADSEQARAVIVVVGRVQGVFFRSSTEQQALRLGLAGEVRNLPDGSVEVVTEGARRAVEELVAWCRRGGPPAAQVEAVEVRWSVHQAEFQTFQVVR